MLSLASVGTKLLGMLAAGLVVAEEKGPLSDLENEDSRWSFEVTITSHGWKRGQD